MLATFLRKQCKSTKIFDTAKSFATKIAAQIVLWRQYAHFSVSYAGEIKKGPMGHCPHRTYTIMITEFVTYQTLSAFSPL